MLMARGGRGIAYLIEGVSDGDPMSIFLLVGVVIFCIGYFTLKFKRS